MPFRPNEYTGIGSASDPDGDGLTDPLDNCPTIFNPPRPLDNDAQPDFDGDGVGDPCDPCPLDANTTTCTPFDPEDVDGDGFTNDLDVCPTVKDPDQLDGDGDGKGDLCDACPDFANPDGGACRATIYDLKSGVVQSGRRALIENAIVTVSPNDDGYFIQVDPDDSTQYQGVDYSGLFVYAPDSTSPQRGDVVTVEGTLQNFFGQLELTSTTRLEITENNHPVPPPVAVTSEEVATGGTRAIPLEGVLVVVSDVEVTDIAPAPGPGDRTPIQEFVVDDVLRINDFYHLITPFPAVGETFTGIAGVLRWGNNNSKIEPRDELDIITGPPRLSRFEPALAFLKAGSTGTPLTLRTTRLVTQDTLVDLSYTGDAGVLSAPPATLTISANQQTAILELTALAASTAPVTVTASLDGDGVSAEVRVYDDSDTRSVLSLEGPASLTAGASVDLVVTLDLPAPTGGQVVDVVVSPGVELSASASVTVPEGDFSVTIPVTAGSNDGTELVTASIGPSSAQLSLEVVTTPPVGLIITEVLYDPVGADDGLEWIHLYNGTPVDIDLSGYSLGWGGSDYTYGKAQLEGVIVAGGCHLVGGPTSSAGNGDPVYDQALNLGGSSNPQNVSSGIADGVALFDVTASQITPTTVPIHAVLYGTTNSNGLLDESGAAGDVDVGDAPSGESIRRGNDGVWEIPSGLTPNLCPPYP